MQVIDPKYLPVRPPLSWLLVFALGIDRIHAPQWAWGAYAVWVVICISVWITALTLQKRCHPSEIGKR